MGSNHSRDDAKEDIPATTTTATLDTNPVAPRHYTDYQEFPEDACVHIMYFLEPKYHIICRRISRLWLLAASRARMSLEFVDNEFIPEKINSIICSLQGMNLVSLKLYGDMVRKEGVGLIGSLLVNLETLVLGANYIGDDGVNIIMESELTKLKKLALVNIQLSRDGVICIASKGSRFKHLEKLRLTMRIFGNEIQQLMESEVVTQLKKLCLESSEFTIPNEKIFKTGNVKNLTSFSISHHNINSFIGQILSNPQFSNLTSLNLSDHFVISQDSIETLAACPYFSNLKRLNLNSGGRFDEEEMKLFTSSPYLLNLQEISLVDVKLRLDAVKILCNSKTMSSLTKLNIWESDIGSEGAVYLANSPFLHNFTELNLGNNRISSKGLIALAKSANMSHLTRLNITSNNITAEGVKALPSSDYLKNLRWLNLSHNPIGEEGAQAIASCVNFRQLTWLNVLYTSIGEKGTAAIRSSTTLRRPLTLICNQ